MAKKLGRREKNEFKNREIRYLTACSSPLQTRLRACGRSGLSCACYARECSLCVSRNRSLIDIACKP